MRNYFFILVLIISASSCASLKQAVKTPAHPSSPKTISSNSSATANLQFINGIEAGEEKNVTVQPANKPGKIIPAESKKIIAPSFDIEQALPLHFIYASKLGVDVESITNFKLFKQIDEWWGTPYQMGGCTKDGVDCSAFVNTLMAAVFAVSLPRTAREQFDNATKITDEDLTEGDLVFFNTRGGISHVGVYLTNNKFVHASTSGGVMISDLNEPYWKGKYRGAGRVK